MRSVPFFELPRLGDLRRDATLYGLVYPSMPRPDREFGVSVPLNRMLFRTERLAAAIPSLTVFSTGFRVDLTIIIRDESAGSPQLAYGFAGSTLRYLDGNGQLLPSVFRFGLEFADGRRVTSLDRFADRASRGQLALTAQGGGGGSGTWTYHFFVTALPPPGVMRFVAEWPQEGVAETHIDIETSELLSAAASIALLWPRPADELVVVDPREQEAVLLAAVTAALGPSVIAVTGIRARGIRLVGRHPDTRLVVDFDDPQGDKTDQSREFALWSKPHNLATDPPQLVARAISDEVLRVTSEG